MTSPIRIFISYARKDGRDLALRLQKSLSDLSYDVWLDTNEIQGGANWSRDIEQAIDNCQVVLALLSPASFASEICRAEHQRAVEKKKRIIPIMVLPCDRPLILQTLNYRDFTNLGAYDTAFAQLHDDLNNPNGYTAPTIKTIYNNAPPLPPHFIPRPDEYDKLKNALLSASNRQVALTALQGLGGIGKSVMANAVCKDDFLAGAFPDGVFWVEIGREPGEIVDKLKTIGVALGDSDKSYTTLNDAIGNFRNIIAHKSALIVLDDVWEESYKVASYFIGTSPRTRWLVTTRNQAIVNELDATPVQLGMMNPDQAVALMREWAGKDDDQFATIARRLGHHPLAVKIVGTRLKSMKSTDWLNSYDITRVKMGLSAHDRDDNLVACFEVSVNSLPPELPPLYHALGIFPEDKWIPESTVARLWMALNPNLEEFDCTEILAELAKLALVDRQADTAEIRMHDLLHDYNRYKIKAEYTQMQATFIGALGDPYHLPHEYAWRYYAYHLIEAKQQTRLRELLLDYAFLDAKLNTTDINSLIQDYTYLKDDSSIQLIKSALMMSAHILWSDKSALAHQLVGRLMFHRKNDAVIKQFTESIVKTPNNLFPLNLDSDHAIHNPAGGNLLKTLAGHKGKVKGVRLLSNGYILSWGHDTEEGGAFILLWDRDVHPLHIVKGHTKNVTGACPYHNQYFLTWSEDKTLRLWNTEGQIVQIFIGHQSAVSHAIPLKNGNILSWDWNNHVYVWHPNGNLLHKITTFYGWLNGALELSDGQILIWCQDNLYIVNEQLSNMVRLDGHRGMVHGAYELDKERILSWSDDKTLRIWDKKGHLISTLSGHTDVIIGALLLKNGNILSWAGKYFKQTDVTLRLWNNNGDLLAVLDGHTRSVEGTVELNNGNILSWSPDKTLYMWDTHGQILTTFHGHTGKINGAIELPDGLLLSWGGLGWEVTSQYKNSDSSLRLWDKDSQCVGVFTGHTDSVYGAILLPEGHILSWSEDSTLRIWDIQGLSLDIQYAHSNEVYGVFILDDGRTVSWGYSDMICLWGEDGNKLDILDENYRNGDRALIFEWARIHNFDIAKIYRKSSETMIASLRGIQVSHQGNRLYIHDIHTHQLLNIFYGDAEFTFPEIKEWQGHIVIVVGDKAGRVLFLRWVGQDNTPTTTLQ